MLHFLVESRRVVKVVVHKAHGILLDTGLVSLWVFNVDNGLRGVVSMVIYLKPSFAVQ